MKLYVGNLPYSVNDEKLKEMFASYGNVLSAKIIVDNMSGQSKGFGFVELENKDDALKAIKALHETEYSGRNIIVNEARPQKERSSFQKRY